METKETLSEEAKKSMFDWIKKQVADKAKEKARAAVELMKSVMVEQWRKDNNIREEFGQNFGTFEAYYRNSGCKPLSRHNSRTPVIGKQNRFNY